MEAEQTAQPWRDCAPHSPPGPQHRTHHRGRQPRSWPHL